MYKPAAGQFLRLQLLVCLLTEHNLPPYWAWTSITLIWIPSPQVLLQLDHSDNTQSTGKIKIIPLNHYHFTIITYSCLPNKKACLIQKI